MVGKVRIIAVALGCLLFVNSCAVDPNTGKPSFKETFASDDPCAHNSRNIGVAIGVALGAAAGYAAKKDAKGAVIGGGIGALLGGLVGADMDRRRCALSKVAKQYGLDMQVQEVRTDGQVVAPGSGSDDTKAGLVVSVSDDQGQFESGSDKLTPRAQAYFTAIAEQYNPTAQAAQMNDAKQAADYQKAAKNRKLLLVGHTDDTGSSAYNAALSERRARAVAKLLAQHGVPEAGIYYQGAGETLPVADNRTPEGRAKNRRVEIVDTFDDAKFKNYLYARTPNYQFYRSVKQPAAAPATAAAQKPAAAPAPAAKAPAAGGGWETPAAGAKAPAAGNGWETPPATAAKAPPPLAAAHSTVPGIDFGGAPAGGGNALVDVGNVPQESTGFSFISRAYAEDTAPLDSCNHDRPRVAGAVKSLQTGKTYATSEFLPGLYETTWYDKVNGHQLVLNKVAVLREGAAPANRPELKVYTNYNPAKNRNPKPTLTMRPEVNVYRGSNGLLYRVFADGREGVECLDILLPRDGGFKAQDGRLLYQRRGQLYVSKIQPQMLR